MYFKKIEIYGFKSFADKLNIEFGDGITAIVGPNGCGKSNVADSIRWALGEQSPKSLRGSSMSDVIFNGTADRKSLSYCEVLLYFDNVDKIFDINFDEVVISRKLYRSGESEYAINKTPCRLKDITSILHNSGFGRDSYAIIGQGRIDEILSAKPENRRGIFEDAAGISKYKQTKIDNERKLVRVEDKLTTAVAILNELQNNLEPLSQQAEKAQKFFELKKRQRVLDINNYLVLYESAESKKKAVQKDLNSINFEITSRQKIYDLKYKEYIDAMDYSSRLDTDIKQLNEERLALSLKLERAESEQKLIKEKINYLRTQNARLTEQSNKDEKERNDNNLELKAKISLEAELTAKIDELRNKIEDLNNGYIELSGIISQNENETQKAHKEELVSLNHITSIKSELSALKTKRSALEEKIRECGQKAENIKSRLTEDEIKAIKLNKNIDRIEIERTALKAKIDSLTIEYNTNLSKSRELRDICYNLSADYNNTKTQLKMLNEIDSDMRNYSYSIKSLFNFAKTDKILAAKLETVVAKAIKVKPELETAIEMALGAAAQNIITPTEEDAKYAVNYLKERKLGRATFLPVSSVKSRFVDKELLNRINIDGCLGIASDLVGYEKRYENIVKMLLGRTAIAKNLDYAIKIARLSDYSLKIVTLDGDVIATGGAITGGSRKNEVSNIIGYDNQITEAEAKLKSVQTKLEKSLKEREETENKVERQNSEIKKLLDNQHEKELELATEREQYNKLNGNIQSYDRDIAQLSQDEEKAHAQDEEIENLIANYVNQENTVNARQKSDDSVNIQKQEQLNRIKIERDELLSQITNTKVKLASYNSDKTAAESEIKRLKTRIAYLHEAITDSLRQIKNNNDIIETADLPLLDGIVADPKDQQRLIEVAKNLADLDNYKQECQTKLVALDKERLNVQDELNRYKENRFEFEKRLNDIDTSLQIDTEKMQEEYDLDYSACVQFREPDYDANSGVSESNKNRREIIKIGFVNADAIEEYRILKGRVEEEIKQKEDLEKSIADIRKVIKEMVSEMITRFNRSFEQIKINFTQVFRQLFGGGNAKLELEEAEDTLEAGIEIIAEPPGKKLQSISLLSGGERALTAIAILFAILKLRPMPFCVLDEIEAALDDANAERFAKYLQNFSQKTQFIVITHRKPTMELADSLYGVTMEEQGVTKVVSVKLEEAVKVANAEGA